MLQDVATLNLIEMANTLVKLYLGQGNILLYLDMVCAQEISQTSMYILLKEFYIGNFKNYFGAFFSFDLTLYLSFHIDIN